MMHERAVATAAACLGWIGINTAALPVHITCHRGWWDTLAPQFFHQCHPECLSKQLSWTQIKL